MHKAQTNQLFTRSQMSELAGVSDGTLGFWIKNDLLIPTSGGEGRGSHRKFSEYQVCVAALLGQLQQNGVNVTLMRTFSALMQRGLELAVATGIGAASNKDAAGLAEMLASFRAGQKVPVAVFTVDDDRDRHGIDYVDAASEEDVARDYVDRISCVVPKDDLLRVADSLSVTDIAAIQLTDPIISEMSGDEDIDWSMIVWQKASGDIGFATAFDVRDHGFSHYPDDGFSAIWINVSGLLRRVWNIDQDERRAVIEMNRLRSLAAMPDDRLTAAGKASRDHARSILASQSDGGTDAD